MCLTVQQYHYILGLAVLHLQEFEAFSYCLADQTPIQGRYKILFTVGGYHLI